MAATERTEEEKRAVLKQIKTRQAALDGRFQPPDASQGAWHELEAVPSFAPFAALGTPWSTARGKLKLLTTGRGAVI